MVATLKIFQTLPRVRCLKHKGDVPGEHRERHPRTVIEIPLDVCPLFVALYLCSFAIPRVEGCLLCVEGVCWQHIILTTKVQIISIVFIATFERGKG